MRKKTDSTESINTKIIINNNEVVEIFNALEALKSKDLSRKLVFNLFMIRSSINPIVESIKEAHKPSEKYQEYNSKRIEIVQDCAVKENGNPKINEHGNYLIDDNKVKDFNKRIEALKKEYTEALEENITREEELKKLMKENVEVEINIKLKLSMFPKEIQGVNLWPLMRFIEDDLDDLDENE